MMAHCWHGATEFVLRRLRSQQEKGNRPSAICFAELGYIDGDGQIGNTRIDNITVPFRFTRILIHRNW